MKNLSIKGDKFRPEFMSMMTEVDTDIISSVDMAVSGLNDDAELLNALLKYYENHDYSLEDVRQVQRLLAGISVYAQYAGNALADVERTMRKLE